MDDDVLAMTDVAALARSLGTIAILGQLHWERFRSGRGNFQISFTDVAAFGRSLGAIVILCAA